MRPAYYNMNMWPSTLGLTESLGARKDGLLRALASPKGYKRCITSPLRYAGGKSLAVGHIVEHLPDDIDRLVSPFFGGGSVEIACAKFLGIDIIGYDIFAILTNYWQQQIQNPAKLQAKLARWKPNQETYTIVKQNLKAHWREEMELDDLDLAAHYYFNHNLSYGPGFLGWMSRIYEDENRYALLLERVKRFTASGSMHVSCRDFKEVIPQHATDFLYCDPPYYLDGDSKMFRGIYPQRNFPVHHNGFDHRALKDMLATHKGGFILSYNDCQTIRAWYADYKIVEVAWQYTLGQGETRIGANRKEGNGSHVKASHEILIIDY